MTRRLVRVTVNGRRHEREVAPRLTLADFIRDELHLTGTHLGCEHGVCGACTILMNGEAVRSCLLFAVQADGATLLTVESLAVDGRLHPLQEAFREQHGLQCGFCTPGILMALCGFLAENPAPGEDELREAIAGNLCRCTGYQGILAAARVGAARMREAAGPPGTPAAPRP